MLNFLRRLAIAMAIIDEIVIVDMQIMTDAVTTPDIKLMSWSHGNPGTFTIVGVDKILVAALETWMFLDT